MRKDRFTDEALRNARALAELKYSENPEEQTAFAEAYDFARCQRPDGSFYGTSGQCRKGKDAGAAPAKEKKSPEAKAAARAAGGAKTSAKAARARLLKDELGKIQDSIKGKSPEEINKAIAGAAERADKRAAAGEGKAAKKAPVRVGKIGESAESLRSKAQEAYNKAREIGKKEAEAVAKLRKDPQNKDLLRQVQMLRTERTTEDTRYNNLTKKAKKLEKSGGATAEPKPKKLKTDFRKEVAAGAAKRRAREEKIVARQARDGELRTQIRERMAALRPVKGELDRRERAMKEAERRAKKDPSKANRDALKQLQRAVREQDRAVRAAEREIDKMARERLRISKQNERERMTPAQRAEAARVRKIIKERG